ncbi:MAG: hypothetical protein ACT4QC_21760 [Planctomycetaceae bacterium]
MKDRLRFDFWPRRPVSWLVMAACLAAPCGCDSSGESTVAAARDAGANRQSAEDALKAQGAKVTVENVPAIGMYFSVVDLSGVQGITDETFVLLKQMNTTWMPILKINLSGTNIIDEQMAKLDADELSRGVTHLNLRNTAISDNGLREIRHIPSLIDLDLTNTKVTAEGVQAFLKARADNPEVQSKKPRIRR